MQHKIGLTQRRICPLLLALIATAMLYAMPKQSAEGAKIFSYALEGNPESLDFAKSSSLRTERVVWLLCDQLVYVSKDGKDLEPGLAESWTMSPDGRDVVMKLRRGATFHDGTPINASAVKASIERQFKPDHPLYTKEPANTKEKMLAQLVAEIRVNDERTLAIRLYSPGLHYLSDIDIASPTALAKLGKDFGRTPVCSGPFRFESWSDDKITLTAYEKYWGGRPRIDQVVFYIISASETLFEKMSKGELDFWASITDPPVLERLRESQGVALIAVPGINIFYLGMYTERPPFNNPVARKAISHAVNVVRNAQVLGRGTAEAAKGPLSPAMKGYAADVAQAEYNPETARDMWEKAGLQGTKLGLVFNSAHGYISDHAVAIHNELNRIGITVELLGKPSFADADRAVRAREGDMFISNWFVRAPYPERILMPLFHSSGAGVTNLTRYHNPQVDRGLNEAMRLPEGAEQRRLYSQVQHAIVNDAPAVFLFHWTRMAAYRQTVKGLSLKLDSAPADKLVRVDVTP